MLTGPCGGALLALVSRQTHFSLINRVLKHIESQYTENLSVDRLAAEANMSVSAFHHNFKAVTSTSPFAVSEKLPFAQSTNADDP